MTDATNTQNLETEGGQGEGGDAVAAAAAAAAAAAKAGGEQGQDQSEGKSWLDQLNLPAEVRDHAVIKKYAASPEALARGMIHLEGHLGVSPDQLLRLPKPDDAEGMAKFWDKVGRPETPDKYGLKAPDGGALDQAGLDSFLAHMHKSGPMTKGMAEQAVAWYDGFVKQQTEAAEVAFKAARDDADKALKTEWGAAYDIKLDAAAEMAARFGGDDYGKYLKESGLGDDPRTLKAWAAVAEAMGEPGAHDPAGKGGRKGGGAVMTPAEAEAELAKYQTAGSDEEKAINDPNHANHGYHVTRRNQLFQLKRGNPTR